VFSCSVPPGGRLGRELGGCFVSGDDDADSGGRDAGGGVSVPDVVEWDVV